MANTVGDWDRGNAPVAGTASVGYPTCIMHWNVGSGTDHAELVTPNMNFQLSQKGRASFTVVVNVDAASISTSTTLGLKIYGSNVKDATLSKWEVLHTATLGNADIDDKADTYIYNVDTYGLMPYMKIGIDPNQDPGADYILKLGIIPGAM